MNKKKFILQSIYILSFIFFFSASTVVANDSSLNYFNQNEKKAIDEHFPDYRLLRVSDLGSWEQSVLKEYFGDKNFFLIRGDFDGAASEDFACLLYNSKLEKVAFAIFLSSSKHYKLSYHEVWKASRWGESLILILIEVGKTITPFDGVDHDDVPITLKTPGIELIHIGKAASAFYWDDKKQKICVIATAD